MDKVILRSSYIILPKKKLVIDIFDGILTLDGFKGHKLKQAAEKDFSPDYTLLSDFRTIEVRMTINDLKEYADFLIAQGNIVGNRKAAVVLGTPNQLVYTTTYDKSLHDRAPQELHTFLSFDTALEWLDLENSKDEIMTLIDQYRKNPLFEWTVKDYPEF